MTLSISIIFVGVMVLSCVADDVGLKRSTNVSDTQLLYNTTNKQSGIQQTHIFTKNSWIFSIVAFLYKK